MIEDKNLKRIDWRIGKIDKLLCSKAGEIWSAEIVIKNGRKLKLWRPVNKLYPSECSMDKDEIRLRFVKDEGTKMTKVVGECIK